MALKYAFKLIFLECIFEFMLNTAPPTSNSVHGREKCFKCNNFNLLIVQSLRGRGTVVKGQSSLLADLEVAISNSG